MKRQLTHTVLLSSALATVFSLALATASTASPCIFSKMGGTPEATTLDNAPSATDATVGSSNSIADSVNQLSGSDKLGLGIGLATGLGLVGAALLRMRAPRRVQTEMASSVQSEPLTDAAFATNTFAIEVPPAALTALEETAELVEPVSGRL
jgi:hypothetical protein